MRTALTVIRVEHRSLAAVLHGLRHVASGVREGNQKPDFAVLRAIVYYIDAFPEKLHHPKEDHHLFARLRQRTTMANEALDQLEAEHVHGATLIRELEQALLRAEMGNRQDFNAFAEKVEHYADFQFHHMQQEEQVILPLAERVLNDDDWREIDAAFKVNADPLISNDVEKDFEQLFRRLIQIVSSPVAAVNKN